MVNNGWAHSDRIPGVEKPTCVSGRLMIFWREIERNRIESNIWVRVRVNLKLGLGLGLGLKLGLGLVLGLGLEVGLGLEIFDLRNSIRVIRLYDSTSLLSIRVIRYE